MEKIVVKVDGMQCGMCEAHVNEAVRAAFPVKKVYNILSCNITGNWWNIYQPGTVTGEA